MEIVDDVVLLLVVKREEKLPHPEKLIPDQNEPNKALAYFSLGAAAQESIGSVGFSIATPVR